MNIEDVKKIAREEFMNNVMEHLDSALIFAYIQNLENQLQQKENIIKEVREDIKYCIPVLEQEEEMSTDERTRKETGELREILKKRLEILDKVGDEK